MNRWRRNLEEVRGQVDAAAQRSGRKPKDIRILAVSKSFPAEAVVEVARCGQRLFGESRVQEAGDKIPAVAQPGIEWHLVGHLQSNKVRQAVELFDVVQSLDSEKLARRLNRVCADMGKSLSVFVQVNIGGEFRKHGIDPGEAESLVSQVDRLEHLNLCGLMTIPPYDEDPERSRPYFRRLADLRDWIDRRRDRPLDHLSMGMSGDFAVAIEEGATMIRVGTAIFGARS